MGVNSILISYFPMLKANAWENDRPTVEQTRSRVRGGIHSARIMVMEPRAPDPEVNHQPMTTFSFIVSALNFHSSDRGA